MLTFPVFILCFIRTDAVEAKKTDQKRKMAKVLGPRPSLSGCCGRRHGSKLSEKSNNVVKSSQVLFLLLVRWGGGCCSWCHRDANVRSFKESERRFAFFGCSRFVAGALALLTRLRCIGCTDSYVIFSKIQIFVESSLLFPLRFVSA